MATLWDILTKKKKREPLVESKITNPLHLRIGGAKPSILRIHTVDLEHLDFRVRGIRELVREANEQKLVMSDYDLVARDLKSNVTELRLRLVPMDNPDGELTHNIAILSLYDEFAYNEGFFNALNANAENPDEPDLQCDDDGSQWWRINDVTTPWETELTVLEDLDHSGKVDPTEVVKSLLTYWDYWRKDNSDPPVVELLFAEMNQKHYFQLYRGPETDPGRVEVLS